MITGKYWPARPKPLPDELLSSWLIRLATANHLRLHTFCHFEWPHKQIWTRDIDKIVDLELMGKLSEKSGAPIEYVMNTSLHSAIGTIFEKVNAKGTSSYIRPIGVRHRIRHKHGLMWCPRCLESDDIPYFRKKWRMILNPTCSWHGNILADSCSCCGSPCIPHRGDFLKCHHCETPLIEHPYVPADSFSLQLGYRNQTIAHTGFTDFGLDEPIHPIAYFDIYRQILKIIIMGARSDRLRHQLYKLYGTDPAPFVIGKRLNLEELSAAELHRAMTMAARLITGWPFIFVGICADAGVWYSWATKDFKNIRYEYYRITRLFLSP